MSVGSDGFGPATGLLPSSLSAGLRPDGLVVVQEVGEVVLDEVLARHSQVHRIPVAELSTQLPIYRCQCVCALNSLQ